MRRQGQVANAEVSVTAGEAVPSGFSYATVSPVSVSVTVSSYSMLVLAAKKTQKRLLGPSQPSSTRISSSVLSGSKNVNSPPS